MVRATMGNSPLRLIVCTLEPALATRLAREDVVFGPGTPRRHSHGLLGLSQLSSQPCSNMPDDFATHESPKTLYFAYGSNIWIDQMNRRCPESKYIGIAKLHEW